MSDNLKTLLAAVPDSYQKTIGFPTYDILAAAALRMDETDLRLEATARKLDPANLSGDELEAYIYPRTGQRRKPAAPAVGEVTVIGNGLVREGALFESAGGIQFAAVEEVRVVDSAVVPVRCTAAGALGNLPPGSITQAPMQLAGIYSVTNEQATHDGYDAETDADYYERFLIQVQTPPTSGNVYHYMLWALEVPGVGAVQVIPLGRGDYTVEVILADSNGQPASEDLVAAVQQHIDPGSQGLGEGEAPIGAYCYAAAATPQPVAVSVKITALAGAAQETITEHIKERLTAYLTSIAFKQTYVSYGKVAEAILETPGVLDFEQLTIGGGTGNVAVAPKHLATLGKLTVTYA